MKNRNSYHRAYRKKHLVQLREYGKLWMRAYRQKNKSTDKSKFFQLLNKAILSTEPDKTKKPKLHITPAEKQPAEPLKFYGKDRCQRCQIMVGKKYYYQN